MPPKINYNEIRDKAYNLLLSINIKSYPINPFEICKTCGWDVLPLTDCASLFGCSAMDIKKTLFLGCDAYTFFYSQDNKYKIVYDNTKISAERTVWTIAHEIGHIVLEHHKNGQTDGFSIIADEKSERSADFFAGQLLAAPIILDCLNVTDANSLQYYCNISKSAAIGRLNHLKRWRQINIEHSPIEIKLKKAFSDFIENSLSNPLQIICTAPKHNINAVFGK